jgi:branched-chain amino acid aminotransferase
MLQRYDPRNRDLVVCINGRFMHRDEAAISPFDSSVQNGDAVWEGLRLYNGRIFKLQAHLDRLRKSASLLQYASYPNDAEIVDALKRTLELNHMFDGVHVRLTVTRGVKYTSGLDPRINQLGCTLIILAEHKPPVYDRSGISLMTAKHRRPPATILNQHIHSCNQLTSILAKLEANHAGADDALLLDIDGNLAETNATHVFVVFGEELHTSTTKACPEGITRSTVLELAKREGIVCVERDIPHHELFEADEMFVTGTMGELIPVKQLDQHIYSHRIFCDRLTTLFAKEIQNERDPLLIPKPS